MWAVRIGLLSEHGMAVDFQTGATDGTEPEPLFELFAKALASNRQGFTPLRLTNSPSSIVLRQRLFNPLLLLCCGQIAKTANFVPLMASMCDVPDHPRDMITVRSWHKPILALDSHYCSQKTPSKPKISYAFSLKTLTNNNLGWSDPNPLPLLRHLFLPSMSSSGLT